MSSIPIVLLLGATQLDEASGQFPPRRWQFWALGKRDGWNDNLWLRLV